MGDTKEHKVKITAETADARENIEKLGKVTDEFGISLEGLSKALTGPLGLTVALAALAAELTEVGVQFDEASSTIARATGATGDNLKSLNQSLVDVTASGADEKLNDIATAIGAVNVRFGLTGTELDETTKNFLEFSKVTGGPVKEAVDDTSRLMQKWGQDSEALPGILDMLAKSGQLTGVSVSGLTQSLVQSAAQFQAVGLDLTDAIGLLDGFEKGGVRTEAVTAALNTALSKFKASGVDAKTGFDAVVQSIKSAQNPTDALNLALETFGTRGGAEMAKAIRSGAVDLEKWRSTLEDSAGTVKSTAEASQTMGEKFQAASNRMLGALKPVGDMLLWLGTAVANVISEIAEGPSTNLKKIATDQVEFMLRTGKQVTDSQKAFLAQVGVSYDDLVKKVQNTSFMADMQRRYSAMMKTVNDEKARADAQAKEDQVAALAELKTTLADRQKAAEETAKYETDWSTKALDAKVKNLEEEKQNVLDLAKLRGATAQEQAAISKKYDDQILAAEKAALDAQLAAELDHAKKVIASAATVAAIKEAYEQQYTALKEKMLVQQAQDEDKAQKDSAKGWTTYFDGLKAKAADWSATFATSTADMTKAAGNEFEELGAQIANALKGATVDWTNMKQIALDALSSVVQGIAEQLAAMAAVAYATLNFPLAVADTAASAAAFVAAGAIKAFKTGTNSSPAGLAALAEDGRPELVMGPTGANLKGGSRVLNADDTAKAFGGRSTVIHQHFAKAADPLAHRRELEALARKMAHAGVF